MWRSLEITKNLLFLVWVFYWLFKFAIYVVCSFSIVYTLSRICVYQVVCMSDHNLVWFSIQNEVGFQAKLGYQASIVLDKSVKVVISPLCLFKLGNPALRGVLLSKVNLFNLKCLNQYKNQVLRYKCEANRSRGFMSYNLTYKQTIDTQT